MFKIVQVSTAMSFKAGPTAHPATAADIVGQMPFELFNYPEVLLARWEARFTCRYLILAAFRDN